MNALMMDPVGGNKYEDSLLWGRASVWEKVDLGVIKVQLQKVKQVANGVVTDPGSITIVDQDEFKAKKKREVSEAIFTSAK